MSNNSRKMDRLEFLKIMGAAAAVTASATSCAGTSNKKKAEDNEANQMTYRTSTKGDKLSMLGYGCLRWPLVENAPAGTNVIDQDAMDELVDYAIEHGVNYFDTAPPYLQGWSEESIGRSLSRYPRDKFYIGTKLSTQKITDRDESIEMYHRSFERLRVDYIDYYMLHSVGRTMSSFNERFLDNGVLDFLIEERKAGRIRNLGWSFHGNQETFDQIVALHETVHWDFVLIQLNYSDWRNARGANVNAEYLNAELEKRGIQVIVMEPLLAGRLSKLPPYIVERLQEREPEKSVASWAFRFSATHPNVLCVLSGMTYMEHLKENLATYSPLVPLDENEIEFLNQTAELILEYPTIDCNDCDYCMPCPYGLDIPGIFVHYNKCVNEGNVVSSTADEKYRKARRAFLVGYDRAIPTRRQADHCIGCQKCVEHCPQAINIPQEIRRISRYVEKLRRDTLGE
ncbi:MAG: aldo/keto reductase [Rikenellaceae bacterium]